MQEKKLNEIKPNLLFWLQGEARLQIESYTSKAVVKMMTVFLFALSWWGYPVPNKSTLPLRIKVTLVILVQ